MPVVKELLRTEQNGTLSFGDYTLEKKTKLEGVEFEGDLYKIKTYNEITKLEKNGMFVYESIPGTAVEGFKATANEVVMKVSGLKDTQITLELEVDTEYVLYVDDVNVGSVTTNLSGKVSVSAELSPEKFVAIKIIKK